jgi:rfaE bifunctional protein nucleotidyltransferase chain/domain
MTSSNNKSQIIKDIVSGSIGFEHRYIPDHSNLSPVVKTLKDAGYNIVLTQGVYDLFHVGHKRYLEDAKNQGDILIVGVDTDELTRSMKGPKRPFDDLENRVELLSGLRAVDIITIRNKNDHMYDLIKLVQPDTLIMSKTTSSFTEKDKKNLEKYCGEIKVLPARAATTTTAKLRILMIDGAEQLGNKITLLINNFLSNTEENESSSSLHTSNTQGGSKVLRKSKARRSIRSGKKSNK